MERTAPFHLGRASHRSGDGAAEAIIQSVGPGLFPGESLQLDVEVAANAHLTVRGQSATKIYASPTGEEARMDTRLRVAAGGTLVYLPGALIPYRDAVFRGETEIELATGARLVWAEVLTSGRLAMGEHLNYRRLNLRSRIRIDGKAIFIERASLDPIRRPIAALGRNGSYPCVGTLVLVGFQLKSNIEASDAGRSMWSGSGRTRELTLIRALGTCAAGIQRTIDDLIDGGLEDLGSWCP